jgi:hypothetical protein
MKKAKVYGDGDKGQPVDNIRPRLNVCQWNILQCLDQGLFVLSGLSRFSKIRVLEYLPVKG